MLENILILAVALFFVIKGATMATKYSVCLAESCRLSQYIIGFIMVAIISILPETFISINSALAGAPSLGLGTLFGSNVADLTLVFAIIIYFSGRSIKIQSSILKNNIVYPFILLIPLVLGFNGYYSRGEGAALIIAGSIFYFFAFKAAAACPAAKGRNHNRLKNFILLAASLTILLTASYFTVSAAIKLAQTMGVSSLLVGLLVISLGTCMPELLFSLKSLKIKDDSLGVGDILGTVLADATIVVGILAVIKPFYFPQKIIYSTGIFMVAAAFLLFYFMRSGRTLSKKESHFLFLFWLIFVLVEIIVNR